MSWSHNEIQKLSEMFTALSNAVNIALNITIKFNSDNSTVEVFSETNKAVRIIDIKDDSAYGALKDIIDNL